jgi:hypothetical protein
LQAVRNPSPAIVAIANQLKCVLPFIFVLLNSSQSESASSRPELPRTCPVNEIILGKGPFPGLYF